MEAISKQLCFEKNEMQTSTDQPMLVSKKNKEKQKSESKAVKQDFHSCTLNHYGQFSFPFKAQV